MMFYVADNAVRGEVFDGIALKYSNHRSAGYLTLHAKGALVYPDRSWRLSGLLSAHDQQLLC